LKPHQNSKEEKVKPGPRVRLLVRFSLSRLSTQLILSRALDQDQDLEIKHTESQGVCIEKAGPSEFNFLSTTTLTLVH